MTWVGQALIATRKGHHADSRMLFEHAVSLSADIVSQQKKKKTMRTRQPSLICKLLQARSRHRVLQTRIRQIPQRRAQPPPITKRPLRGVLRPRQVPQTAPR